MSYRKRSRRTNGRSPTSGDVFRARASDFRSRTTWPSATLERLDPVDLLPFDTAEDLGSFDPVRPWRDHARPLVSSVPLAKRAKPSGRPVLDIARQVLRIRSPKKVMFCYWRAVRRQVLFAKRVAGKRGVGRGKSWNRSANSLWRC